MTQRGVPAARSVRGGVERRSDIDGIIPRSLRSRRGPARFARRWAALAPLARRAALASLVRRAALASLVRRAALASLVRRAGSLRSPVGAAPSSRVVALLVR